MIGHHPQHPRRNPSILFILISDIVGFAVLSVSYLILFLFFQLPYWLCWWIDALGGSFLGLLEDFRQNRTPNRISIEVEAVNFGILVELVLGCIKARGQNHAITPALRVGDTGTISIRENLLAISEVEAAVVVGVVLTQMSPPCHLLAAELYFLATLISGEDLICLIAAGPDHELSFLNVHALLFWCACAYHLDSRLLLDILIQILSITSEARISIKDTICFRKKFLIEVSVLVFAGV